MKTPTNLFATLLLASAGSALADVHYVDVNSTNATPPYTSWATAATIIQDAVDSAMTGDEIVVTNGIYATGGRAVDGTMTNRVAVNKSLKLRSVNGPQFTIIQGRQVPGTTHGNGAIRCAYLTSGASLSGFTLTNGATRTDGDALLEQSGAGLWCASETAAVSNCVVAGNSASFFGGGTYYGTLNNCTLTGNFGYDGGGANGSTLRNCALTGNSAFRSGGGAAGCILNNCTLVGNSALVGGGASYTTGEEESFPSTLNNCIVYSNAAQLGPNYYFCALNYSCTTPLPTNGVGNITNAPLFVNSGAGNYRLRPDSPCIDAGTNLSASITNDLDGRPRPLDGNGDGLATFDMGAYEYRTPLLVWQDSPNPTPPHGDWATAAHTIQDAVDAAVAGDEIVVTNGIYATGGRATTVGESWTNRVAVDKPLGLRSVNGPQFTTIDGGQSNRCVYLTNGASFSGFTMTNGFCPGPGAGVFCTSQTAVVSNCVMVGNFAYSFGGGGAYGGTLNRCLLTANYGNNGGGAFGCTLNNCTLSYNRGESSQNGFGGGAHSCTLNNCTLSGNIAGSGWSRTGFAYGGGAFDSALNNCTLTGNSADYGSGALGSSLNNCTVTGNSAGYYGGGVYSSTLNNCIATGNSAGYAQSANYDYSTLNYCCTTPLPTNGVGNITNAPLFVNLEAGNLRLQSNSPCINAGLNAFAPAGPDPDGYPRIMGNTVDIGAYEFQLPPQLTITASGTNVILAWPTNYAGVVIQEDHYEAYFLYSTTNLVSPVAWRFVYPPPVVINGRLVVTNTIDGTQRFYRLVKVSGPLGDVPCLRGGPKPCPCYECISGVWTQFGNCRFCDGF